MIGISPRPPQSSNEAELVRVRQLERVDRVWTSADDFGVPIVKDSNVKRHKQLRTGMIWSLFYFRHSFWYERSAVPGIHCAEQGQVPDHIGKVECAISCVCVCVCVCMCVCVFLLMSELVPSSLCSFHSNFVLAHCFCCPEYHNDSSTDDQEEGKPRSRNESPLFRAELPPIGHST